MVTSTRSVVAVSPLHRSRPVDYLVVVRQ